MQPTPAGNFFKFVAGFLTFISISFGVTYFVNSYTEKQQSQQEAAAIRAILLDK